MKLILSLVICLISLNLYAAKQDSRVRNIQYNKQKIYKIYAQLGKQLHIQFEEGEKIQAVSMGDTMAWQAVTANHHLLIKPTEISSTNMTVITDLRDYQFDLETKSKTKPLYKLVFIYPKNQNVIEESSFIFKDCNQPYMNRLYSFNGSRLLKPLAVCDDGRFTYFTFSRHGIAKLPAIFSVDQNRNESLVNFHMEGNTMVIHEVAKQFTLRSNKATTTLYNQHLIGRWKKVR